MKRLSVGSAVPNDTKTKILRGALDLISKVGISKLTVEEVALNCDVSRMTIYRYFPKGKDQLLSEVIAAEAFEWLEQLMEHVSCYDNFEDVAVYGLMFARRKLLEHRVLNKILEEEPEALLPMLTIEANRIIAFIHLYVVTQLFKVKLSENLNADEVAEYLARMLLSVVISPGSWDLTQEAEVRLLVRTQFLAVLNPPEPS
jgi:AcrR family transcriptional regulator